MANPFDQFDKLSTPAAPAPAQPGQEAAVAPVEDPANPFNDPAAAVTSGPLDDDAMTKGYYERLNAGASAGEILDWSREAGRPLDQSQEQLDKLAQNIAVRDQEHAKGNKAPLDFGNLKTDPTLAPADPSGGPTPQDMGAVLRRGANQVLFNFGDELASGVGALIQTPFSKQTLGENYRDNWLTLNAQDQVDQAGRPVASTVGDAMGIAGSVMLPGGINTAGRGIGARMGIGLLEGGAQGGINATGQGRPGDRFGKTAEGTVVGGAVGGSVPAVTAGISRVARPVIERLPGADPARAFARRLGLNADEMGAVRREAEDQAALVGDENVALIDALPERARNVVGTAGRVDGARETLQDVATERTGNLPTRVRAQADRISPEARTPDELRTGIEADRDAAYSAAIEPIRNTPIPIYEDVAQVLQTRSGLRAIRRAIDEAPDVTTRQQMEELYAGLNNMRRAVDPRLPEATQQRMQDQSLEGLPFTVDISERIKRALRGMGNEGNSAMYGFADTVAEGARAVSPRLRQINEEYGVASDAARAVGVGDGTRDVFDAATGKTSRVKAEGEGFLAERPSRYEERVGGLKEQPVTGDLDNPIATIRGEPAPSERELMQAGAADAVRQSASDVPGAVRVARQLSTDQDQLARTAATVGPQEARIVQRAMDAELRRVQRVTDQVTSAGPRGEGGLAGVESSVNAMYNPGPISFAREAMRFMAKIGMRERDANWIVQAATDPAQRNAVIARLEQAGLDRLRAESYSDMLGTMLVRGATNTEERR